MTPASITHKICSHCNTTKTIDSFSVGETYKDGHCGQCKACRSKLNSERVKKKPQKRKPLPHSRVRTNALKYKFRITDADYERFLSEQSGRCAICKTDKPGGRYGTFNIDHCHSTGLVRGLLCHHCNLALGMVGDGIDGLMKYVEYLKSPQLKYERVVTRPKIVHQHAMPLQDMQLSQRE